MIVYREVIHSCPTEHEQEVADLKAEVEHWRQAAIKLQSALGNVQMRMRQATGLIDRAIEEAFE